MKWIDIFENYKLDKDELNDSQIEEQKIPNDMQESFNAKFYSLASNESVMKTEQNEHLNGVDFNDTLHSYEILQYASPFAERKESEKSL